MSPATLDDALISLVGPAPAGPDPVVVTFDDGTADFVDVALPILVAHTVSRPSLYVATDFIERGRAVPRRRHAAVVGGAARRARAPASSRSARTRTRTRCSTASTRRPRRDELDRSIELIDERLGVDARALRVPEGAGRQRRGARPSRAHAVPFRRARGHAPNPYGDTDPYRLARSPVQRADGMHWFEHKLAGGLRLEDDVRRLANRVRYIGADA